MQKYKNPFFIKKKIEFVSKVVLNEIEIVSRVSSWNQACSTDPKFLDELKSRIERIKKGERDLYF